MGDNMNINDFLQACNKNSDKNNDKNNNNKNSKSKNSKNKNSKSNKKQMVKKSPEKEKEKGKGLEKNLEKDVGKKREKVEVEEKKENKKNDSKGKTRLRKVVDSDTDSSTESEDIINSNSEWSDDDSENTEDLDSDDLDDDYDPEETESSEYETVSEMDAEDEEDEDSEDSELKALKHKKNSKINILLTLDMNKNKRSEDDYEDEDDDYEDETIEGEEEEEDENVSVSTVSSISTIQEPKNKKNGKNNKGGKKASTKDSKNLDVDDIVLDKDLDNDSVLMQLKELKSNKKGKQSHLIKCIEAYSYALKKEKRTREKKEKKQKAKNVRICRQIFRKQKTNSNDIAYFATLTLVEQKKILAEMRELNKLICVDKPYKISLLGLNIPIQFKVAAIKKLDSLKHMELGSGEYYKIQNWIDTFMTIPFGKYAELPVTITDGLDKCDEFLNHAQKTLDGVAYGLNDAKAQIMQMLGQLVTNPASVGSSIAIHGPPGTGKTSLVKEGISKILNRPFAFIALGGSTDSSFLEGHGYTYEGSTWGKIVQILIDSKCMNPVIYFDELDKISDSPRGEEITGILTHLTDTSQNSQFHDKYFRDLDFDLSKCLFIFSYNDETKVNRILKDRMYRISTKGYSAKEKCVIASSYLLPSIRQQIKFTGEDIVLSEPLIAHIVETYCKSEDGVRNLKRCLEVIHTKLNLYRLTKPENHVIKNIQFPLTLTKELIDKLIKLEDTHSFNSALYSMYV